MPFFDSKKTKKCKKKITQLYTIQILGLIEYCHCLLQIDILWNTKRNKVQ